MGAISSKPQLERRNTILKRSQRSEIHKIHRRAEEKSKEVRGCANNGDRKRLFELKNELDALHRKLSAKHDGLHPSCNYIFNDTMALIKHAQEITSNAIQNKREDVRKNEVEEELEPVEIEEQVAPIAFRMGVPEESSEDELPQMRNGATTRAEVYANRQSEILKMGVAVMPESIIDKVDRRTRVFEHVQEKCSEKIDEVRSRIEAVEAEINDFVGRKGGEEYVWLWRELEGFQKELDAIHTDNDEEIIEQIGNCSRYIQSCFTFLDEKTIKDFSRIDTTKTTMV